MKTNHQIPGFVFGLVLGGALLMSYQNCSHVPTHSSVIHDRGPAATEEAEESAAADVHVEVKPAPRKARNPEPLPLIDEEFPPHSFTLKINSQKVPNRLIRAYLLSTGFARGRNVASAGSFQSHAQFSVKIFPRDRFPEPIQDCAELVLVLQPGSNGKDDRSSRLRFQKLKAALENVRGSEVTGDLQRIPLPDSETSCRTLHASQTVLRLPYDQRQ